MMDGQFPGVGERPPPRGASVALDQAMLRAYSYERCLDYGCSVDDVVKLRRSVDGGCGWADTALRLATDDLRRAQEAKAIGRGLSATSLFLHAAACYRLAQAALEEHPSQRLAVYERLVDAFAHAMSIRDISRLEIAHNNARHGGWLFKPLAGDARPACVLVWGGADGWCEAFYASVPFYLERGLAVCLIELPGQGLARLRDGSLLTLDFAQMVAGTLNALARCDVATDAFGVAGHSMGGSLAIAAAAADDRIRACCTNGGSVDLARGLAQYPRVLKRLGRMLDSHDDEETLRFVDDLRLDAAASKMQADLLCLHGGKDVLVTNEEADALVRLRGSDRATLKFWAEGVHCLYNHSFERNCVMADWFADRLGARKDTR
jgi:alpha-beta hydrolase superfamily lysophospholipase